MTNNCEKSKVVYFRHTCTQLLDLIQFLLLAMNTVFEIVDRYRYLNLMLTEHLDFNITA
jgi:hypothetical protein